MFSVVTGALMGDILDDGQVNGSSGAIIGGFLGAVLDDSSSRQSHAQEQEQRKRQERERRQRQERLERERREALERQEKLEQEKRRRREEKICNHLSCGEQALKNNDYRKAIHHFDNVLSEDDHNYQATEGKRAAIIMHADHLFENEEYLKALELYKSQNSNKKINEIRDRLIEQAKKQDNAAEECEKNNPDLSITLTEYKKVLDILKIVQSLNPPANVLARYAQLKGRVADLSLKKLLFEAEVKKNVIDKRFNSAISQLELVESQHTANDNNAQETINKINKLTLTLLNIKNDYEEVCEINSNLQIPVVKINELLQKLERMKLFSIIQQHKREIEIFELALISLDINRASDIKKIMQLNSQVQHACHEILSLEMNNEEIKIKMKQANANYLLAEKSNILLDNIENKLIDQPLQAALGRISKMPLQLLPSDLEKFKSNVRSIVPSIKDIYMQLTEDSIKILQQNITNHLSGMLKKPFSVCCFASTECTFPKFLPLTEAVVHQWLRELPRRNNESVPRYTQGMYMN